MVIPLRQRSTMGRKQDQAMSKFGVRKQVDQGQVRKKQQDKPKDIETMRRGPLKSKAGFTLYTHCSDTVKQTKPPVYKSLASSQKQTQGENEAEKFLQQPDVVSQMQIQNEQTRSGETSSIVIPTGNMESSGDSTMYGHLDYLEFGTPFNKRLVSSTPDPESLLEADLLEHHMNQPSMMYPQVIPERDTSHPSKPTDLLATVASNLSEKLKVQRQQFQQNQQLLQQKQGQQSHNQGQQQSQQLKNPVSLNLHDENIVSQKLISQPVVDSSDLPKMVATPMLGANVVGAHGKLKKHPATSVDHSLNSQQDHAMRPTGSNLHHSSGAVTPKKSVHSDTADDNVSVRTKVTQNGGPVSKVTINSQQDYAMRHTNSQLHHSSAVGLTKQSVHLDTTDDIVSVGTKVSQNGDPVSKVVKVCSPDTTQSNTIPSLSQPDLTNDNIKNCQFAKIASPKYKTVSKKAAGNNSSSMKHLGTATEAPTSAFSRPETYTGTQNSVMSSYLESSTIKTIPFPKLWKSSVENKVPELSVHEDVVQHFVTDNRGETNNLKSYLVMKTTDNYATQMSGDQIRGGNASTVKSKTTAVKEINVTHQIGLQKNVKCLLGKETKSNVMFSEQPGNLNTVCITSPLKSQKQNIKIGEDLRSQLNRNVLNDDSLDTSTDTCDLEVNNVLKQLKNNTDDDNSREGNSGVNGKVDGKNEDEGRISVASVSSNLSHVIQFLKTDAFNQARESECGGLSIADSKNIDNKATNIKNTDIKNTDNENTGTTAAYNPATDSTRDKQPGDKNALAELMQQYLPETLQNNESNNNNKHVDTCFNSNARSKDRDGSFCDKDSKSKDQDGSFCDKDSKSKDPPAANFAEGEVDLNINQNHFHDEESDEEVPIPRRWKHLQYLERMADPALRDVTCRLALKATALRDVELRELIDEMILVTDASLGQEDARFQSAQIFFAEENNKLKKRIQTINQQLDAKERQERMGTFCHSDNDVLHLERKMMYLRDEKEKLDNQVTTLLEEKAKWLITQQDLVRTLSLKDHELLKLEEKHHQEKKSLLHSLEQATQNSQGVHYKLSVADKEISNLEQCIKARNMEIVNLKDLLKGMEGKLKEFERHSKFKSQEIVHLHDLVDALKIGVGHVLQAYESSCNKDTTTVEQRQGMKNLRQMVHPEQYRNKLTGPGVTTQAEQRKIQTQGPHHHRQTFSSSQTSSLPKERKTKNQFVRQEYHPGSVRGQMYQRHHSMEDSTYTTDHDRRYNPQDDEQDLLPLQLTSETLKEHNKRFTPVNKLLWRSLDNEPTRPPFGYQDPYYSDSEIEINGRSRRRSSFHRHGATVGNLRRQFQPCSHLPHGQSQARREWYPKVNDDNWDVSRRSLDRTLQSETVPKSRDNFVHNLTDPLSEETYYSTLRSESIPEKPFICERKPGSINLVQDSYQPMSQPATYQRHGEKNNINRRNGQQHSFRHEYEQIPERAPSENSWDLNGEDGHFVTPQSAQIPHCGHGSFQHDVETLPKTVHEGVGGCHSLFVQEDPSATIAQTDRTMLQKSNQPVECGGAALYMPQPHTHHIYSGRQAEASQMNDSLENPSFSRHSALPSNDLHCIPNESSSFSDISLSRRATRNSDSMTQREYFQGTELSASLSTISEVDAPTTNNNLLKALNEDLFSSGIATLDEKIADLQRKINRTKALYS